MKRENLLRNIYFGILILLFGLIVSTPLLIGMKVAVFKEGVKELVEGGMLFALVIIGFVIQYLYRKELDKREKELTDTLKYIGAINLQVDQIKSIFDIVTKYPESKKDFKFLFEALAERALAGVNSEWVLFRIVDIQGGKTVREYTKARGRAVLLKCELSNKELLDDKKIEGCQIIASTQENLDIKVFCVMPIKFLNENQKILLKAIVNNLSMLYLIFDSVVVRKHNNH